MKISEYIFFHTTKILFDLCIKEVKLSLVFQIGKNNAFREYPKDRSIHSFFDDMAKTIPDNIAVEFENKRITYRELKNLADRIASILVSLGINAGKVAAVITERSFNMIAAILAVLKSGAAYLPIEPGIPDERKKYYLKTAEASVILSNADSKKLFDLPNINIDKLPDNSIPYIAAVEVLVRPFLESEEFLLAREILTGNENRLACCRRVHDGVGVLLVERINAVLFYHLRFLRF